MTKILKESTIAWKPQPGPQSLAIQCPALEVLMGGAVGGGKSDFLLGDFARDIDIGKAWQGVYFRRYTPDMDRVIQRSQEIFAPIYGIGCYSASKYQWNFPSGACLRFRAMEKDTDTLKHQGQDYCVEKGTLIRMGDGSMKPIQDIAVGEKVMTLEGPQAVIETHGPFVKECVEAVVTDDSGELLGSQVHPVDHPILTDSGHWASYKSLSCSLDGNKTNQIHECRKSSSQQDLICHDGPRSDTLHEDLTQPYERALSPSGRMDQQDSFVSSIDDSNCSEAFDGCTQEIQQPLMLSVPVMLLSPDPLLVDDDLPLSTQCNAHNRSSQQLSGSSQGHLCRSLDLMHHPERVESRMGHNMLNEVACETSCACYGSETEEGSQSDYQRCSCQHDGQVQSQKEFAVCGPPSRDGVASQTRSCCKQDEVDIAQAHSLRSSSLYEHPYTGKTHRATEKVDCGSCEMTPCGKREVYDLTVDNVAHYISESRLISKNSWIGFDELTQWATPYCYTYMFATRLRSSGLPPGKSVRMRAATNPGGPGHNWTKHRFIDPMPAGTGLHVQLKNSKYWRVFIPSKLEDNQILMKNDPGYGDRIYEMSDPILAIALREGRWDKVEGAAMSEFDPKVHVIDPYPIPNDKPIWRSMDWGFKTPYACLWFFADNEGDIIVANEIYGWSGQPDVGTEESPADVRSKIESYEASHGIYVPMGLLDNQCWEQRGLEGVIAEELGGTQLGWKPWPKGPNSRVQQKQLLHQMMRVVNGKSRLKIMRNCRHLIRTLPIIPTDKHNPEDVDTRSEDHAYDALRAGLTHRMPTRDELRRRAIRKRMNELEFTSTSELPYGGC